MTHFEFKLVIGKKNTILNIALGMLLYLTMFTLFESIWTSLILTLMFLYQTYRPEQLTLLKSSGRKWWHHWWPGKWSVYSRHGLLVSSSFFILLTIYLFIILIAVGQSTWS